jgi:hypothetical protein
MFQKGIEKVPGSGRKKGVVNLKTRALAERCHAAGTTPLETLIELMCAARVAGEAAIGETKWKRFAEAADYASRAAPYMHGKKPTVYQQEGTTKIEISWRPIRDN